MAQYGYAIYDDRGREVTGLLTPVFFLDKFTQPSGSKTYQNRPPGKSLKAIYVGMNSWRGGDPGAPSLGVSGDTVTWSGLSGSDSRYIYTFWG
ncbi:outer membrane protein [Escherichia phage MikeNSara]|nr:hypothetical protein bas04_0024 [Escherichia phage FritzSarasin]